MSGTPLVSRPSHLPGVGVNQGPQAEPIPVPTQKLAYQQIQESLIRSRTRSGESTMSGISSTGSEGASTLGPLPEEGALKVLASAGNRNSESGLSRKSPTSSPSHHLKSRRVSAPSQPIPDICQLSPPSIQFTLGTTPPTGISSAVHHTTGGRRRTSSSSSCGTPPPSVQWQISPNSPIIGAGTSGRITPTMTSPVRRHTVGSRAEPIGSQATTYNHPNCSTLSPILGSPNKTTSEGVDFSDNIAQQESDIVAAHSEFRPRSGSNTSGGRGKIRTPSNSSKAVMQWQGPSDTEGQLSEVTRAGTGTLCIENLTDAVAEPVEGSRNKCTDLQFGAGRNVVLNFGTHQGPGNFYERSSEYFHQ